MFRALFSVAIVLLLSTIALLLYANYIHEEKPAAGSDLAAKLLPQLPAAPVQPHVDAPPPQPVTPPPAAPAPTPVPAPAPRDLTRHDTRDSKPNRAHAEAGPGQRTYVVEAGDSLWNISMKNYGAGDYTAKIAEMNHLSSKDHIRPGQVLIIPDAPKHAKPETLSKEDDVDQTSDASPNKADEPATVQEPEPVTTTEKPEPKRDGGEEIEVQPPMLNVQVKRP